MGMKKIVLIVCFLLFGSALVHAQNNGKYLYHTVEQGETLFGISREYGIQIAEIKDLNPELGSDLKLGQILLIPSIQREKIDTARIYTVKKGDTWYGIARSLEISVEQLQTNNGQFSKEAILKPGDKILIPSKTKSDNLGVVNDSTSNGNVFHKVRSGETIYGLTRKYNLNKGDLYVLNPSLVEEGLKLDQFIIISSPKIPMPLEKLASDDTGIKVALASTTIDPNKPLVSSPPAAQVDTNENLYELYRIKKEDNIESLRALKNLSEAELLKLNPELAEGVIPGRYIILPTRVVLAENKEKSKLFSSSDSILRIAILLPFSTFDTDSIGAADLQSSASGKMKVKAAAFYAGILLAKDSLDKAGIAYQVKVFDTRNERAKLKEIANDPFLSQAQFTIGPFYGENVSFFAELMKYRNPKLKIISPLSSQLKINGAKNVCDLMPNEEKSVDLLVDFISKNHSQARIVLLAAESKEGKELQKRFKEELKSMNSEVEIKYVALRKDGKSLPKDSIIAAKSENKTTVYVSFGKSALYLSDLVRNLQGFDGDVVLMTAYEWVEIPMVELRQINQLHLVSPRKFYLNNKDERVERFNNRYISLYSKAPDLFGFQGWDSMMYLEYVFRSNFDLGLKAYHGLQSDIYIEECTDGGNRNQSLQLVQLKNMTWQKIGVNH